MTRVILATFFLVFTSNAISQAITVTHTFQDATTASAAEVNQNFTDLINGVDLMVRINDTLFNTAVGTGAIGFSNAGTHNTASGYNALVFNTTGNFNTASGYVALLRNTKGSNNTASGYRALQENNTGSKNTASGYRVLFANTTGDNNTAVGYSAGASNSIGSNNTAIGANTDFGSTDLTNATVIGYNATVQASNTVRLGNANVVAVKTSGTFFSQGVQITSDARLKEDVTPINSGLALVNDLNPVSYHRTKNSSNDIEMGLLAQEVEEVLAAHGLSNSGMVHQASEDAYRSVRYNDLLAPMIRAIQELDDAAEAKDQQIASLQEQLKSQQEEVLVLVQSQQEQMAMQQEQIAQLQRMVQDQFAAR